MWRVTLIKVSRNRVAWVLATAFCVSLPGVGEAQSAVLPSASTVRTVNRDTPDAKIDDARRALEQAAVQVDFASDAREIELLQQAHDDLSGAIDQLHGPQRQRTLDVLSDLNQAMHRATASLGRLIAPGGEGFGPLVPSRQLLRGLATEALELQRNAPELQRLPSTIVVEVGGRPQQTESASARAQEPIRLVEQELLSWPLAHNAAWP